MMNKLFMIVLSVCCLLMAACGTDNDETPQGLRIVDTDVDLAAGGGTVDITDRLVTDVCLIAPQIIRSGTEIKPVSLVDLLTWMDDSFCSFTAKPDRAIITFYKMFHYCVYRIRQKTS